MPGKRLLRRRRFGREDLRFREMEDGSFEVSGDCGSGLRRLRLAWLPCRLLRLERLLSGEGRGG